MEIYQIKTEYREAFRQLEQMDGVTPEMISDTLSHLSADFEEEALALAAYIKNLEIEVESMKDYESNMKERRRKQEERIEDIKYQLKDAMAKTGFKKINGIELSVAIRESEKGRVKIIDEKLLDDKFFDETIIRKPNLNRTRDALNSGEEVIGAEFEKTTTLIIKG